MLAEILSDRGRSSGSGSGPAFFIFFLNGRLPLVGWNSSRASWYMPKQQSNDMVIKCGRSLWFVNIVAICSLRLDYRDRMVIHVLRCVWTEWNVEVEDRVGSVPQASPFHVTEY